MPRNIEFRFGMTRPSPAKCGRAAGLLIESSRRMKAVLRGLGSSRFECRGIGKRSSAKRPPLCDRGAVRSQLGHSLVTVWSQLGHSWVTVGSGFLRQICKSVKADGPFNNIKYLIFLSELRCTRKNTRPNCDPTVDPTVTQL